MMLGLLYGGISLMKPASRGVMSGSLPSIIYLKPCFSERPFTPPLVDSSLPVLLLLQKLSLVPFGFYASVLILLFICVFNTCLSCC